MTILIFGKDGQVGRALQSLLIKRPNIVFFGRKECDLSDAIALKKILDIWQPKIIINAAAYTAVDKAESDSQLAFALNAKAPEIMSKYIANLDNGLFIHYSTDYVFADTQQTPYSEDDDTGPAEKLSIYGQSKLAGEKAIFKIFTEANTSSTYFILRTSWVYGDGNNFIKKIIDLAKVRERISVVADQVGVPTSANFLASLARQLLYVHTQSPYRQKAGIYHAVPCGYTSWHGLASYVIQILRTIDTTFNLKPADIMAISASDYLVQATRPFNSRLSNKKLEEYLKSLNDNMQPSVALYDWRVEVQDYVRSLVCKNRY